MSVEEWDTEVYTPFAPPFTTVAVMKHSNVTHYRGPSDLNHLLSQVAG